MAAREADWWHKIIERWRERIRVYPEPLRRAMIERHWDFFPLWYDGVSMAARDAELWRLDLLLDGPSTSLPCSQP